MVAFDFQSTSRFVGLGRTSFDLHSLLTLGSGHKRPSARDKCKHWTSKTGVTDIWHGNYDWNNGH